MHEKILGTPSFIAAGIEKYDISQRHPCRAIEQNRGSEFNARKVKKFIRAFGALPIFIEPGSPPREWLY